MDKIFLSHPFSKNPQSNFKKADILAKYYTETTDSLVISPLHLFSYFDEDKKSYRKVILEICKDMLLNCDIIMFVKYKNKLSKGQKEEYSYAKKFNDKHILFINIYDEEKYFNKILKKLNSIQ